MQKSRGLQFCYYPSDKLDSGRYPACHDSALKKLVDVHIKSASQKIPTIAYYDLDTQKFLGGQLFSVKEAQRSRLEVPELQTELHEKLRADIHND